MTDESQPRGSAKEGKRVPAIFFRTEAGREPVRDWLKSLPLPENRKRIGEGHQDSRVRLAYRDAGVSGLGTRSI